MFHVIRLICAGIKLYLSFVKYADYMKLNMLIFGMILRDRIKHLSLHAAVAPAIPGMRVRCYHYSVTYHPSPTSFENRRN